MKTGVDIGPVAPTPSVAQRIPRWSSAALLLLAVASGCGEPPRMIVFPVHGKVQVNGRPAAKAEVTLHPKSPLVDAAGRAIFPHAIVKADGSFDIETYADADGAPAGEYVVTVIWPKVTVEGGEEVFGPDQLLGHYNHPTKPAATVVVEEHENNIPPLRLR